MIQRSIQAADTRAASAALARPAFETLDRYLLIDDGEDDSTQFITVICQRSERGLEVVL